MSRYRKLLQSAGALLLLFSLSFAKAQNVIKAEYFVDTDPGYNNGVDIPVTPGTDVTANFQLPVTGLSLGFHNLFIRAYTAPYTVTTGPNQGPKGGWSITNSRVIYKDNILLGQGALPNIVKGEYFYDTDPGTGNATAISFTPGADVSNVTFTSDITSLSLGFHYLYVRFLDANGHWSLTTERVLYKELFATGQGALSPVVKGEYFFDTDPGTGNGRTIAFSQGTDITNIAFTADITSIGNGFHNMGVRFKNANGQWSLTSTRSVYKAQMQVTNPVPIVKIEQFLDTDPGFGSATNVPFTHGPDVTVNFVVNLTGQPIGNHTLYLRALDANGKWSLVNNADIHICTPATLSATHTDQSNCNTNDGSITLTVNGGTAPFTYLWSNGSTTQNISNLAPGNYTINVTDAQPCPASLTVAILPAVVINLHMDSVNTTCGNTNGSATVSVSSGGSAPFTYLWNTGATTPSISGLAAGVYTVTVTDHNNCIATTQVNIGSSSATAPPVLTVSQSNDPCTSAGNTISSSAADNYLWSTGATTQSIMATATGTYKLTVTTNGCSASDSVAVIISNGNKTSLTYSGAPGFTTAVVNPSGGIPTASYRFEVKYTNSAGIFPTQNYPQVVLDVNGNGIIEANDLVFYMIEKDPTDHDVIDGKDYYYVANGLPESANYTTTIVANDRAGCTGSFGPFAGPRPLTLADVSIFANDITFSNPTPSVSSPITVYATIHNNSGSEADNFVVHLVNQYAPSTVYPDITVPHLSNIAPNNTVQVSWNITTPAVPAWCPMQVYADYTNVLPEANELDNQAIRPFTNGNFQLPGDIAITAGANPPNGYAGSLLSVSGNTYYRGTAVHLVDSSCAGATVTCSIVETLQTFSGYTDAYGNYSIPFNAPTTPGLYHLKLHITDYTLNGDTTALLTVIQVPPCTLPDLTGQIIFKPGLTYNPNLGLLGVSTNILAGDTIGGILVVTNVGLTATDRSTGVQLSVAGGSIVPGPYTIPVLQPGDSFKIQLPPIQFNMPMYAYIQTIVDYNNNIAECDESNTTTQSILVLPPLPDIIAYNNEFSSVKQCLLHSIGFKLSNGGGLPTGNFNARLIVKLNNVVVDSVNQTVASIAPLAQGSVSFDFSPSMPGLYTYYLQCDIPDTIIEVSETNNNAIAQIQVLDCYPDLTVLGCGSLDVKPVDPKASDTIQISATVYNGGYNATTTLFRVKFLVAGSPYYVAVNDPIRAQESKTVSVTIPTPPYGNNQLTVIADADSVITEESETNNTATGSLCVDFALTNQTCDHSELYISTSQYVGVPVTLKTGLFNLGLYKAGSAQVKFEVSGPGITGTQTVGFINTYIANTCGCPLSLVLPGQFVFPQTGLYQVTITADYNNLYQECNEANNVLVIPVTVTQQLPDYVMRSEFIAPSLLNPDVDQPVSLDITYLNQGSADATNIEMYTQVDNTPFDSLSAPGLANGKYNTVHMNNTWSSSVRGVHIIRAIADHQDAVTETDKTNNDATRAIIVGRAPNLRFTSFAASDTVPANGQTITVSATITNDGFVGCLTTFQLFYLDNSNTEQLISQRSVVVDSLGNLIVTVPWTVTDPATKLIARISNTNPVEYNFLDNDDTIEIGKLIINLSSAAAACSLGKTGIARAQAKGGVGAYTKLWSTGETGDSILVNPGTYTVTVSDADGNSTADSVVVGSNGTTPSVTASASGTDICAGTSVTLHGGGATTYVWSDGGGVSGIQDGVPFVPLSTGTYHVTGTVAGGCGDTASVTIVVHALPVINNVTTTPSSGSNGSITITATGATQYSIDNSSYQSSNLFSNLAPGNYTVYAKSASNCTSSQTVTVATAVNNNNHLLTGNAGTVDGVNFLGTRDNQPLNIRVNNQKAGRIDPVSGNTFYGVLSGASNTTGTFNIANGYQALYKNTTGSGNLAIGYSALYANTTGGYNTAIGYGALDSNTTGNGNFANGTYALRYNTTGIYNTANGYYALGNNLTGNYNIATGYAALLSNTTGSYNTATGWAALYSNTTGTGNLAYGYAALRYNTTGSYNTANGYAALTANVNGGYNNAFGYGALQSNTSGSLNTASGYGALYNSTGGNLTAVGYKALYANITGVNNTAVGGNALATNTTGSNNTALGYGADANGNNYSNSTAIGYGATITGSNNVMLGNASVTGIYAQVTGITALSDGRFKKNIKDNVPGLAFINLLQPVTYNYNIKSLDLFEKGSTSTTQPSKVDDAAITGKEKILYTGLVAQDVDAAAKKINYDFSGIHRPGNEKDPYGINYSNLVIPLIKTVQELSQKNDSLQQQHDLQLQQIKDLQNQLNEIRLQLSGMQQGGLSPGEMKKDESNPN